MMQYYSVHRTNKSQERKKYMQYNDETDNKTMYYSGHKHKVFMTFTEERNKEEKWLLHWL